VVECRRRGHLPREQHTEHTAPRRAASKARPRIVTLAVLIGRNQTIELSPYLNLALERGVMPAEGSDIQHEQPSAR